MLLKEWRWERNLDQSLMAKELDVSQPIVSFIEKNFLDFMEKFVKVYGEEEAKKILEFKGVMSGEN